MADDEEQPSRPDSGDQNASTSANNLVEAELRLRTIAENSSRSPALRTWAQTLLGQIAEIYAAEEAETGKTRSMRLAEVLGLDDVPTLSPQQRRDLQAATARAEAEADRIYGSEARGRNAA